MKFITLTASEVIDGVKVELGKIEKFPVAETFADIQAMEDLDNGCNEEEAVSAFNSGWKVKSQAKIRSGSDPKAPSTVFKKASREKQDAILKLAKEQGLL